MNALLRTLRALFAAAALMAAAACGDDDPGYQLGGLGGGSASPNRDPVASRMEVPALQADDGLLLAHWTVEGGDSVMTYCLEFSPTQLHSRWVAFRFDGQTRQRTVSRSDDPFRDDPQLPASLRIGSSGFGRNYNRGHLCASADRLYSRQANEQTFYMSNMSPQLGAFNQGYWIAFEDLVQELGRDATFADTLYVVKGGTIAQNQVGSYVSRSDGKRVAVPRYYFMALLKVKNRAYSAIAFWMEHRDYGYSYGHQAPRSAVAAQAVSVDRLEELTGIDFFHNLPDQVESQVERSYVLAAWDL